AIRRLLGSCHLEDLAVSWNRDKMRRLNARLGEHAENSHDFLLRDLGGLGGYRFLQGSESLRKTVRSVRLQADRAGLAKAGHYVQLASLARRGRGLRLPVQ